MGENVWVFHGKEQLVQSGYDNTIWILWAIKTSVSEELLVTLKKSCHVTLKKKKQVHQKLIGYYTSVYFNFLKNSI